MPEGLTGWGVIVRFMRPYRRRLVRVVLVTVLLSVAAMSPPLVMRAIVDRVLTEGQHSLFPGLAVLMVGLPLVVGLSRMLQTIGIARVGQGFVFDLRAALYRHLLGLSLRFHTRESTGKLVYRLMGDSGIVQRILTAQTIMVLSDIVSALFAISVTFVISFRLSLVLLALVAVFIWNYRANIWRIRRTNRDYQWSLDRLSAGVQNRLVGALAIKTFGSEEREHEAFSREHAGTMSMIETSFQADTTFSLNTQLIQQAGRAVIFFMGCGFVLRGDMTYGDVLAFTAYSMQLLVPAVRFSEIARQIQRVGIAMDRLLELYRETPEVTDRPGARRGGRMAGRVDFERVNFEYDKGVPILEGFDLHVEPGKTVALIGPTGCGKTTVLSLIMRFYDVCSGRLLIDGVDVRDWSLDTLRRQFGIVLQEPLLFNVSLAENIRYARHSATREDVCRAAAMAEMDDFIRSLPEGYDTVVGEEGVDLSVGQKQRLAIARAVLADPAILVMDEATSALDSDSERIIQRSLERALRGRTSFIVAHRLSTIRNADIIVLLDDGKIVEQGTHDELMADADGRYRDLYLKHMGSGSLAEDEK